MKRLFLFLFSIGLISNLFAGFTMDYADDFADDYPDSYWKVTNVSLFPLGQQSGPNTDISAIIIFGGYVNQGKLNSQKQRVIGTHVYVLKQADFQKYFDPSVFTKPTITYTTKAEDAALGLDSFFTGAVRD